MQKAQLIGDWKNAKTGSVLQLRPDGSATVVTSTKAGAVEEAGTWEYLDARHWRFRLYIPPQPDQPGLEEGAWDVTDYEVISFADTRMECTEFDDTGYHIVFERAGG